MSDTGNLKGSTDQNRPQRKVQLAGTGHQKHRLNFLCHSHSSARRHGCRVKHRAKASRMLRA